MVVPRTLRSFIPNHFVCLAEKEVKAGVIEVDDSNASIHNVMLETSCVDLSAQINFNVPENHGILSDLSDLDETDRRRDNASVSDLTKPGQTAADEKPASRPNKKTEQTKSKQTKQKVAEVKPESGPNKTTEQTKRTRKTNKNPEQRPCDDTVRTTQNQANDDNPEPRPPKTMVSPNNHQDNRTTKQLYRQYKPNRHNLITRLLIKNP